AKARLLTTSFDSLQPDDVKFGQGAGPGRIRGPSRQVCDGSLCRIERAGLRRGVWRRPQTRPEGHTLPRRAAHNLDTVPDELSQTLAGQAVFEPAVVVEKVELPRPDGIARDTAVQPDFLALGGWRRRRRFGRLGGETLSRMEQNQQRHQPVCQL